MSDPGKTAALYVGLAGDAPRTPPARIGLGGADRLELGRADTRKIERRGEIIAVSLVDARMSTHHARLTRTGTTWVLEDLQSKNGTYFGPERVTKKPLSDGDAFMVGHTMLVYRAGGGDEPDTDGGPPDVAPGFVSTSATLGARLRELTQVARGNQPIEITGETGTGKELLAHAAHALSGRETLVVVDCAEPSESLIAEDLDRAAGGTLFLDDVAELPAEGQANLLQMLVERDGKDLRIVTASTRELDGEVIAQRFRADLRARLQGFAVAIPSLRRRREDLAPLVAMLLERLAPGRSITFTGDALGALYVHDWPLNVHELERSLAAALAAGVDRIELQHLPAAVGSTEPMEHNVFRTMTSEERKLRDGLVAAIARHQGNLAGVAREMGKDRTQIRRWMKRFGITREST